MIELWVVPAGLREGHDPDHADAHDVLAPDSVIREADRVMIQTKHCVWIVKDRDGFEPSGPQGPYVRVVYDPSQTNHNKLKVVRNDEDERKIEQMREALHIAEMRKR